MCQLCSQEFTKNERGELIRIDAATDAGPWAWMCEPCFNKQRKNALGIGRGQRYEGNIQVAGGSNTGKEML